MKKTLKNLEVQNIFLLMLLLLIGYLAFRLFTPYFNIILISLVIVQVFHGFYRFILRHTKSTALSTIFSVLITIILVVLPIVIILLLTFGEIKNFSDSNNIFNILGNLENSINDSISNINAFLKKYMEFQVSAINLKELAVNLAANLKDQLLPITTQILSLSGEILFNLFLLILCMIYLFPMYDKLPQILSRFSPLDNKIDHHLFNRFRATVKGVLKGSLVVSVMQATAVLIPLLFLGVGAPVLLWILMVILSIIPVGSGLVWGPIGIAMIIDGASHGNSIQIILGILLMVYSAIIINVIDTTMRPRLMKNAVNMHPLATIFSVLGGIALFGALGILYGPIIYVLFVTIMEVYNQQIQDIPPDTVYEDK